jgi:hypothetical protein
MPPFLQPKPLEPSREVLAFIRSRAIRWRYGQAKQQKGAGAG